MHDERWQENDGDGAAGTRAPPAASLFGAFERPAQIVLVVCQMLLGLGLGLTLILKIYMLLFTDAVCAADMATLSNMIRCTPALALMGQTLMLVAAFRLAALLFSPRFDALFEALALATAGALIHILAALPAQGPVWQQTLLIAALVVVGGALVFGLRKGGLSQGDRPDRK
jgi:hypothetical protein